MRIVSLLPSATEIAASLGLFDQLVGVSHECDYPAAARSLPQLTSSILDHDLSPAQIDAAVAAASLERRPLYAVDGARLAALAPDLILIQGVCAVCAVTPQTISDSLQFARLESACSAPVLVNLPGCWPWVMRDAFATVSPCRTNHTSTVLCFNTSL